MKQNLGPDVFIPMPVALAGALVDGTPNFMTVGWMSRVNYKPPYLAISLNKSHYTPQGIRENRAFSLNFPDSAMMQETDYCGLVSGRKVDKSNLFAVFYGDLKTAPLIEKCCLCIECRLVDIYEMPSNDLFIGEIVGAHADEKCLTDGQPDLKKMDAMFLTMPDNRYWTVGEYIGDAWRVGKEMQK